MNEPFLLALFASRPELVAAAEDAGIDAVVVDWERRGKEERQAGADTQIGVDGPGDLERVRKATGALVLCRIDGFGETTAGEVELAAALGADEVLLPMVRSPREVEAVLGMARGRCRVGILVETLEAVACARELACLPLSRVFVGLNDLAIARRTPNIFAPVVDGLLEEIRAPFGVPFGFGGLTLPEGGAPIPCRLLVGEMARLGCTFGFLRRSFLRDVAGRDLSAEIARIRASLRSAALRTPEEAARDRAELVAAVRAWSGALFPQEALRA